MANSMEPGEYAIYQQWKMFGDDFKEIRDKLITFMRSEKYQHQMTVKQSDTLGRALRHLEKFASRAEDRMFEQVKPTPGNDHLWLSVFFGPLE